MGGDVGFGERYRVWGEIEGGGRCRVGGDVGFGGM